MKYGWCKIRHKKRKKCLCCNKKMILWQNANVWHCKTCGYKQQDKIKKFNYDKKYIKNGYGNNPTLEMSYIRLCFIYQYLKTGRILDIGYGDGEFIRQSIDRGYDAYGFDVHTEKFNVPTINYLAGNWDIVTMFDSFEHMHDINEPIKLRPRYFFITVPHVQENMAENEFMAWRHYKPDEHLHYFTPVALKKFFAKNQYKCIENTNIEDIIRKSRKYNINTMTFVFRRRK